MIHLWLVLGACGKLKYKRNTVIYNCLKFPSHSKIALKDQHQSHKTKCICTSCHKKCKVSQHTCLVCSRCVPAKSATVYSSANYDFKSFIVSCCIPQVQDRTAEEKYIYNSCHSTLATCTDETPSVPKHVKNPVLRSAANFLMSLSELPRYVCTCCHRMLFPRTVAKFNMSDYDMTNAIVRKCLSHRIALNFATENDLSVFISAAKNMSARGMNQCIAIDAVTDNEFICIRCKNALHGKKPRMPDQACANGLVIYNIPEELANMFPIECRIISLRILFITLIVICRYGGHYKINGPPVNVPATLDQIVKMLPRMPGELQLHPLKLKRRLQYKSHYMYDMVRKDKVIGAIMWLKEHNKHYQSIPVDTSWLENEPGNDVPVLPCENPNDEMLDSGVHPDVSSTSHNEPEMLANAMGQASEECESNRSFDAPLSHMHAHGDAHFVSQQFDVCSKHDDGTFEHGANKDHSGLGDECIEEQHEVSGLTEHNGVINTRVESCSDEMGHDNVDVEEATNELVEDQEEIN